MLEKVINVAERYGVSQMLLALLLATIAAAAPNPKIESVEGTLDRAFIARLLQTQAAGLDTCVPRGRELELKIRFTRAGTAEAVEAQPALARPCAERMLSRIHFFNDGSETLAVVRVLGT